MPGCTSWSVRTNLEPDTVQHDVAALPLPLKMSFLTLALFRLNINTLDVFYEAFVDNLIHFDVG